MMAGVTTGRATAPGPALAEEARQAKTLSVCCMTSGRRPALLAGVLAALRSAADEVVVAVEAAQAEDVHAAVGDLADTVLSFPKASPADRPIAWLFRACSGDWIFNVDDDEVPSQELVDALPELSRRDDITHAWVARRWLYPGPDTYIASAPWGTEFQLRLVLADERFLQFSDVFHRPVVCHGPSAYVEAPLWHLDTVLNPAAYRRLKAAAYERERPGMRVGGLAHNTGMYLPELHPDLELLPVPARARQAIAAAQALRAPAGSPSAALIHATAGEIDRDWVGPPYPDSLYRAVLTLPTAPARMAAGVQHTVDVRVANESDITWRWGPDARPEIRLAYRWRREAGGEVQEPAALRTTLPADLSPGTTQLVPVHVVAPAATGSYVLEVDLVHEGVRWFGTAAEASVEVRDRRRVAVLARAERVPALVEELELAPEIEPVAILRDAADRDGYDDFATVVGLRRYLLDGTDGRSRVATLLRVLARALVLSRPSRASHWSQPEYATVTGLASSTERLVVDGPTWAPDAAFGREWAWVVVTALLWRSNGRPVVIADGALPRGRGLRTAAVRWILRRLDSSS